MFSRETRHSIADAVNDNVDVLLDTVHEAPERIVGELALPVICFVIAFFAGSQGFFDGVFPDAGWGFSALMGTFLYAVSMTARMYVAGALAAPESAVAK